MEKVIVDVDDSKEKILNDWNSKILKEPPSRYGHLLVFKTFNDLYRYLKGVAREFGKKERKNSLNQVDRAVAPRDIRYALEGDKIRKKSKKGGMENTANILFFLKRAKDLKRKLTNEVDLL